MNAPLRNAPDAASTTVLVFSHQPEVREAIMIAVGRRPAPDIGRLRYVEAGTLAEVLAEVDSGAVDLAILDGEAQPTGGMGLSRQLKNEITDCPPIIVAVRRRDDRWLATWSQADAIVAHPIDAPELTDALAELIAEETGASPGELEPWLTAHAVLGLYAGLLELARDRMLAGVQGAELSAELRRRGTSGLALLNSGFAGYARRG